MSLGPDAARYLLAGSGQPVARPFNLRWLLPAICRDRLRWWWVVWGLSWVLLGLGQFWLASTAGLALVASVAASVALLAMPGVLGPAVVRPVGVDLPAMALAVLAAAAWRSDLWWLAIGLLIVASCIKETTPVWAALWAWTPLLLPVLLVPAITGLVRRPQIDPVTNQPHLRMVHDHPVRTALAAHSGRWRDARLWLEPWGPLLLALGSLDLQTATTLVMAHLQVLVATDTVRLVQTAAGPVVAIAAMRTVPVVWTPAVAILCVFWWRNPERI